MNRRISEMALAAALLAASSTIALAGVSQEQADRLGTELTPIGAEKAGNAAGTIPEWTGGITEPPGDFQTGQTYADPFADDPILYTITSENMGEYADVMTDATKTMMETYSNTYLMNVYQSRRSCAYPENVYAATKANATRASLVADGNGVDGALLGFPFPLPQEGVEIVWNHNLRYRGFKLTRQFAALAPTASGAFTPIIVNDQVIFPYSDPAQTDFKALNNISLKYTQVVVSPARRAGEIILVHETINQLEGARNAWQYSPGQRRVRRAPTIAYDNPQSYSEGLQTSDNFDLYNGSPDRYSWSLVGKSEKLIPYNSYKLGSSEYQYTDIARPGHINQDLVRYELHRVWTVEADLRPGKRHIYAKRVKHFDEDSWNMVAAELYDSRGEIWRVQEGYLINYYDVPVCYNNAESVFDTASGRYTIQGLKNQEPGINFFADEIDEEQFTPSGIRQLAKR